jgi:hypothetical protein
MNEDRQSGKEEETKESRSQKQEQQEQMEKWQEWISKIDLSLFVTPKCEDSSNGS